jgi:hypothetical protein
MPTFRTPQTVQLSAEAVARAQVFADAVTSTVDYRDSNQTELKKIRDDHFVSKLGEEAVRTIFEARNCKVDGPDYAIYEGRQKSWVADLRINDLDVAVKTQRRSAAARYGLSWTFQDSPARRDPILETPEAWVSFVVFEDAGPGFECVVYPLLKVKKLVFDPPLLLHLVGKKKVVYLDKLIRQGLLK